MYRWSAQKNRENFYLKRVIKFLIISYIKQLVSTNAQLSMYHYLVFLLYKEIKRYLPKDKIMQNLTPKAIKF